MGLQAQGPAGEGRAVVREGWRFFVEDPEGATGWIARSQLDPQRGALVVRQGVGRYSAPSLQRHRRCAAGRAGRGSAKLGRCREGWCEIEVAGRGGWVVRERLWGAEGLPGDEVTLRRDAVFRGPIGRKIGRLDRFRLGRGFTPRRCPCGQQRPHQREQILARRDHTSFDRHPAVASPPPMHSEATNNIFERGVDSQSYASPPISAARLSPVGSENARLQPGLTMMRRDFRLAPDWRRTQPVPDPALTLWLSPKIRAWGRNSRLATAGESLV